MHSEDHTHRLQLLYVSGVPSSFTSYVSGGMILQLSLFQGCAEINSIPLADQSSKQLHGRLRVPHHMYPPVIKYGNGKCTMTKGDFPIETPMSSGFPIATFDYRSVPQQVKPSIIEVNSHRRPFWMVHMKPLLISTQRAKKNVILSPALQQIQTQSKVERHDIVLI